ncbi:MAG: hypothetical protein ACP5NW_02905 [Candidatus Woesearchaeota archaeon]
MPRGELKRGIIVFFSMFLILIFLPSAALAFGIATPYIEDNTLKLRPGEEYIYRFAVQNGEDKDYHVTIAYNVTEGIVGMMETYKVIPRQTYDNTFEMLITVPRDAPQGKRYYITYSARPEVNDSGSVIMGVEIVRSLIIEVKGDEVPVTAEDTSVQEASKTTYQEDTTKKYLMVVLIIIISIMVLMMIGKTSRSIALKVSSKKDTDYTISQAMSLEDVKGLLKKMSDEEYAFPEIKKIFREKLSELSSKRTAKHIDDMSRKELIEAIEKFGKGKYE